MGKRNNSIIILVVLVAFLVGTITANPVVEAAGGWKAALENLTVDFSQLTNVPAGLSDGDDDTIVTLVTTTRTSSLSIAAGGTGGTRIFCVAGEKVTGGGIERTSGDFAGFNVLNSFPSGNGWSVFVHNGGDTSLTYIGYVLCSKLV